MLASSSMGSQPSLAQEIPPTYFGLSTWLLMILPCLLPIHIICTWKTLRMRKKQERTLGFPSSSRAHPNCFLLEKFHQQQLLRNLARPHSRCRPKIPPRLHQHSKGHYENSPKNLQSTKLSPSIQHESTIMTTPTSPPMEPPVRTHLVYLIVLELTGKVLSDQTGRFPVISNRGMKYIFLLYDYNSSTILAEPIKFRSATYILATYTKLHDILKACILKPLLDRLDNKWSIALK